MINQLRWLVLGVIFVIGCGGSHESDSSQPKFAKQIKDPQADQRLIKEHCAYPLNAPNGSVFYVSTLKQTKKDCFQCHQDNLHGQENILTDNTQQAHTEILLEHAPGMSCNDCHNTEMPSKLDILGNQQVEISQSYQLCSKCHAPQAEDWHGGAHGKRLTGWEEVRIVENCTGCHNPHQPSWDKRYPKAQPNIVPKRLAGGK